MFQPECITMVVSSAQHGYATGQTLRTIKLPMSTAVMAHPMMMLQM